AERLRNGTLDHLHLGPDVLRQRGVVRGEFGGFGGVHDGFPAVLRQVRGELEPAIHPGPAVGRPAVSDHQHALHEARRASRTAAPSATTTRISTKALLAMAMGREPE